MGCYLLNYTRNTLISFVQHGKLSCLLKSQARIFSTHCRICTEMWPRTAHFNLTGMAADQLQTSFRPHFKNTALSHNLVPNYQHKNKTLVTGKDKILKPSFGSVKFVFVKCFRQFHQPSLCIILLPEKYDLHNALLNLQTCKYFSNL